MPPLQAAVTRCWQGSLCGSGGDSESRNRRRDSCPGGRAGLRVAASEPGQPALPCLELITGPVRRSTAPLPGDVPAVALGKALVQTGKRRGARRYVPMQKVLFQTHGCDFVVVHPEQCSQVSWYRSRMFSVHKENCGKGFCPEMQLQVVENLNSFLLNNVFLKSIW